MDIQAIAVAATALLGPFLAKAGEGLAEETGKKLAEKVGVLYQVVKRKFKGDAYAEQALVRAEEKPESGERQSALKAVLVEKMEDDPDFAETVRRLVEEAKVIDTGSVIALERSVAIRGDVKGSTIITGDSNVVGDSGS